MEDWMYYGSLLVVLVIAVNFFRGGHLMLTAATLAVGAWIIYSHEENVTYSDIKHDIYKTIDENAKSEYNKKGIGTEAYDYNLSKAK
jgi:hypothetical protein